MVDTEEIKILTPVNIYLARERNSRKRFISRCHVDLIPDPPLECAAIDFVDSNILFFIRHLTQLMKKHHPFCSLFIERTNLHRFLGLEQFQAFRRCIGPDLLEEECTLQEDQFGDTWTKARINSRHWNNSWFYSSQVSHRNSGLLPPELRQGREIGLLVLESLHIDPDLWSRVLGRYYISSEFYCYLYGFNCLSFCIDTQLMKITILYKKSYGLWHRAHEICSSGIQECLPSCIAHLPFPSLKDLCLVVLFMKRYNRFWKLPLDYLQKQRAVQLHTLMNRFNLL